MSDHNLLALNTYVKSRLRKEWNGAASLFIVYELHHSRTKFPFTKLLSQVSDRRESLALLEYGCIRWNTGQLRESSFFQNLSSVMLKLLRY